MLNGIRKVFFLLLAFVGSMVFLMAIPSESSKAKALMLLSSMLAVVLGVLGLRLAIKAGNRMMALK